MASHYVPPFTQSRGLGRHVTQRAACGAWVNPNTEHSVTPTCVTCEQWLEADEAEAKTIDQQLDARFGSGAAR